MLLTVLAAILLLLAACASDPTDASLLPGQGACSTAAVGDACGGGIVFVSDWDGDVLVAADSDEPTGGAAGFAYQSSGGLDSSPAASDRDGRLNTGTFTADHPASQQCQQATHNGYSDWYLPAALELEELRKEAPLNGGVVTGLADFTAYWSSTQVSATQAKYLVINTGPTLSQALKTDLYQVRCIRRP